MGLIQRLTQKGQELSNEQKAAFVLLTFLGLGGITLGFLSFGANIRRPFDLQLAKSMNDAPYLTIDQRDAAEKEAQKTRDTDSDGLTDYDELYVFRTSPYISDTDSDGIDDKTEAYAGTNPNCPEGKTCGGAVAAGDSANTAPTYISLPGSAAGSLGTNPDASLQLRTPEDIQNYLKSVTAAQIRASLTEAGVPKDKLDAITDEQMKELFAQTLTEANASGQLDQIANKVVAEVPPAADDASATPTN